MKKFILPILLFLMFIPFYVNAESKYLYDVLKDEVESGGLAREYTGEHHDSFTEEPSHKIYHWYAENNNEGNQVLEKNNVIFANHCWQMIRTTDTGGVKMIYNGEVENNQCLDTRGTHVGYASRTSQNLASNYWYGTDYIYDSANKVFSVSGTTEQITWNATTGPNLIGKYTCKQTNETGTCATLYLVESYYDTSSAYVIPLNPNSNYSQFGALQFNVSSSSISDVGYMYNTKDSVKQISSQYNICNSGSSWNDSYYAASSMVFNDSHDIFPNRYKLLNPIRLSNYSNKKSIIGKYIMNDTAGYNPYYVLDVSNNMIYYRNLSNGDMTKSLIMGSSYTLNNDGTYTINNPSLIKYEDWYNSSNQELSSYSNKYVCDGENATCANLKHLINYIPANIQYNYVDSENWKFKYASSIKYENGKYILDGDIKTIWDLVNTNEANTINTHHYTCLNTSEECDVVKYIVFWKSNYQPLHFIELKDGKNINDVLNETLFKENVNKNNSIIKFGIDAWYKHDLLDYSEYIEDTIYCNNRNIQDLGFANPLDGKITDEIKFYGLSNNRNIYCENSLDSFSINNSKAKLLYPIGMITSDELKLLGDNIIEKMEKNYWNITPGIFYITTARNEYISSYGYRALDYINESHGVRPVISLKPNSKFKSGNGSQETPYIVDETKYYSVNVEVTNETEDLNININDMTQIEYGEEVSFKITTIRGYKVNNIRIVDSDNNEIEYNTTDNYNYTFVMPASNVTIIPSYEKVKNSVNIDDNSNTKEFIIEVDDSTAIVYEDKVVFRIEPEDGYIVDKIIIKDDNNNVIEYKKTNNKNEYEFIMPDTNVIITPIYRKIESLNVPDTLKNPNTGTGKRVVISIIALVFSSSIYLIMKKRKITL